MSRDLMPRVYELMALIEDPSDPRAYFQDFEETIRVEPAKRQVWLSRERDFRRLDPLSWDFLKSEALPYLMSRDQVRGWSQLISILNQARAYNFLVDEGCQNVRFIPRAKAKGIETPDVEAKMGTLKVLCEVKSIQISQPEAKRRANGSTGSAVLQLEQGFFNKLTSGLLKARNQLQAFDENSDARLIAFVVTEFDDFFAECKQSYFEQIDKFLAGNHAPGIEVVLYNQRAAFHPEVRLKHATVVNEL
jgi:hypothetical protein